MAVVSDIFTKFSNPPEVILGQNMPFDEIQDGELTTWQSALPSLTAIFCAILDQI